MGYEYGDPFIEVVPVIRTSSACSAGTFPRGEGDLPRGPQSLPLCPKGLASLRERWPRRGRMRSWSLEKQGMPLIIAELLREQAITEEDLAEFSPGPRKSMTVICTIEARKDSLI